jgi:hypothetical protein
MLILGRAEADVAGIGSEVVEPTVAAFVSEVEVMQHILAGATDTMTGGPFRRRLRGSLGCCERRRRRIWRPARQSATNTDTMTGGIPYYYRAHDHASGAHRDAA